MIPRERRGNRNKDQLQIKTRTYSGKEGNPPAKKICQPKANSPSVLCSRARRVSSSTHLRSSHNELRVPLRGRHSSSSGLNQEGSDIRANEDDGGLSSVAVESKKTRTKRERQDASRNGSSSSPNQARHSHEKMLIHPQMTDEATK